MKLTTLRGMSSFSIFVIGLAYYLVILLLSRYASRNASEIEYMKTSAPAWLATLGIVGDSISGVTYLSVPGTVAEKGFSYLAICAGYVLGYWIIAFVLLPLYHQKNLVSIYEWLGGQLGSESQKISSGLFVLSRIFGSAARLCLTAGALHLVVFKDFNLGPELSIVAVTIGISIYTLRSGVKSLIVTDLVQSGFMVLGVLGTLIYLISFLYGLGLKPNFVQPVLLGEGLLGWGGFFKSFFSGALITVAMNGLDQNIMQKTFSVESLKALQTNFMRLAVVMFVVNAVVLVQGSLLSQSLEYFPNLQGIPSDQRLIQFILRGEFVIFQVLFFIGLSAATLNSADSVITTVTSSIQIDLIRKWNIRLLWVHLAVTTALGFTALAIYWFASGSAIDLILKSAGWTYGPLLGFFAVAAFRLRNSVMSLRLALFGSVLTALAIHQYFPLGVEVILAISLLMIAYNALAIRLFQKV